MSVVLDNTLLQGAAMMSLFWWVWFRKSDQKTRDRQLVIAGIAGSAVAILAARVLARELPFRERPLSSSGFQSHLLPGVQSKLIHWSSFPSDHAVLYFSLATTVFFASRKAGLVAYFQAVLIACLPRLYFGIHYPTDILVGASLGIAIGSIFALKRVREVVTRPPLKWVDDSPGPFFAVLFVATLLIATNYDPLRTLANYSWWQTKTLTHTHLPPSNWERQSPELKPSPRAKQASPPGAKNLLPPDQQLEMSQN